MKRIVSLWRNFVGKKDSAFFKYYDTSLERNYWVLGYFGGGSINIMDAYYLALEYSRVYKVKKNTVHIDEILSSRSYKHFKYMYSMEKRPKDKDAMELENVFEFLSR
jgi:hypothetical protein